MKNHIATISLLNCFLLGLGDEPVEEKMPIKIDPKLYYSMIPEVVDKVVQLVERDRYILKTILINQANFYENLMIPAVLQAYHANHDAGDCAASEERLGKIQIRKKREFLESKIDGIINEFLREWTNRQSQPALEVYYLTFWKNRYALYEFVFAKPKDVCGNSTAGNYSCTAVGELEKESGEVAKRIMNCEINHGNASVPPAADVSKTTASTEDFTQADIAGIKQHFAVTPEVIEVLKGLARTDRNVLKTIDETHSTLLTAYVPSMVLETYNFSAGTSDCALAESRAHSQDVLKRKEIVDAKIDEDIDKEIRQWDALKTQDDLKAYYGQFWENRNSIYKYVVYKEDKCGDTEPCSGFGSLDNIFGDIFWLLSKCKEKFWKP